jgi:hypothetical protein
MPSREKALSVPCLTALETAVPTCVFGFCNNSVKPSCVCFDGFAHDHIIGRYNNCGLPIWIPWVGGALSITITLIGFLYAMYIAYYFAPKATKAWKMTTSAGLASLMLLGGSISLHTEGNMEMPVYGALLNNLGLAMIAYSVGFMVRRSLA